MSTKEYLVQLKILDVKLRQKLQELRELSDRIICIQGVNYSEDKELSTSSSYEATFARRYEAVDLLEREVEQRIQELIEFKHRLINEIQSIDCPTSASLLFKRYVEFKKLDVIAREMNYSYNRIRHLHGIALKNFEKNKSRHTIAHFNVV